MEKIKTKRPYCEPQVKVIQLQYINLLTESLTDAFDKDEFAPTWN